MSMTHSAILPVIERDQAPPTLRTLDNTPKRVLGLPEDLRNHAVSCIAEFVGTFMFLLFAFVIAQIANLDAYLSTAGSNPPQLVMIALGFGFSVMVQVFIFFRISGGQLNPAVSLTLLMVRAIGPVRFLVNCVAQLLAGICAAAVADALTPGPVLFSNAKGGGVNTGQALFVEVFATALLCMTVAFMAVEKQKATFMAPFVIGIALFVGHMFSVYFSGAGLNPARSLGPNVVMRSFPGYHWIYWVGPALGALLSAILHYLLVFLRYETANPGQDASE